MASLFIHDFFTYFIVLDTQPQVMFKFQPYFDSIALDMFEKVAPQLDEVLYILKVDTVKYPSHKINIII